MSDDVRRAPVPVPVPVDAAAPRAPPPLPKAPRHRAEPVARRDARDPHDEQHPHDEHDGVRADGAPCCLACGHAVAVARGDVAARPRGAPLAVRVDDRGAPVDVALIVTGRVVGDVQVHELTKAETTVGRVDGNDVVLRSGALSKRQLTLTVRDGRVFVADAGSTCGTYLNGARIASSQVIGDGDTISVADFTLQVRAAR